MQFRAELEIDIDRQQTDIFEYLANAENMPRWSAEFQEMEKLTDGPPGKGTRWRFRLRQEPKITERWKNAILRRETAEAPPVEGTVEWVEFEPPRVVGWQGPAIHRGPGNVHVAPKGRFIVEARDGGGSHVQYILEPTLEGVPGVAVPLLSRMLRKGRGGDLVTLKSMMEAGEDKKPAPATG